jgi:hypothetical protein
MPLRDLRVCVFLDWQNLYHRAREAFVEPGAPAVAHPFVTLAPCRLQSHGGDMPGQLHACTVTVHSILAMR